VLRVSSAFNKHGFIIYWNGDPSEWQTWIIIIRPSLRKCLQCRLAMCSDTYECAMWINLFTAMQWLDILRYLVLENAVRADDLTEDVFANMCIDSTQRIVKQIYVGILVDCTSQAHALLLTSTQIDALWHIIGVVVFDLSRCQFLLTVRT